MMAMRDKNSRMAMLFSILLHVGFLLLFLLIKVHFKFDLPEFVEIAFVSGTDQLVAGAADRQILPSADISREPSSNFSEDLSLPLRKLPDQETPPLKVVDRAKALPGENMPTIPEIEHNNHRNNLTEIISPPPSVEEKEVAQPTAIETPAEKLLADSLRTSRSSRRHQYRIEGAVANRTVVYRIIPEYPENLQTQGVIRIRFTVLPNGNIGEMIPIIKSDATLEKITLDALRQWRFNPLPDDAPQRIEQGVITFRYLLK